MAHVLSLHCHVHCAGRRPTVTGAWHLAVDRPPQEEPKQVTVFFIVGGIADREKVSYARYLQSSQERPADLCEVGRLHQRGDDDPKILPELREREDSKFEDRRYKNPAPLLSLSKSRRLDDDDALLDDGAFPSFCASCCSFNV